MSRLIAVPTAVSKGAFGEALKVTGANIRQRGLRNALSDEITAGRQAFRQARSTASTARAVGFDRRTSARLGRQSGMQAGAFKKAFATRDQNSSIGTTTTRTGPVGPGQRPTLAARSGVFSGKTRGVGRKESRDQNSSPKVQTVQARTLTGQFASGEMKLHVVHPKGRFSRQPKSSALGIYRKGRGKETTGYVEKGDTSQATGVVMHTSLYGRGNSRFGGAGTSGRRLRD